MQKYPSSLLAKRSEYCAKKGEELVAMLDDDALVFYYQNKIDENTLEPTHYK